MEAADWMKPPQKEKKKVEKKRFFPLRSALYERGFRATRRENILQEGDFISEFI